jgi:hypothetical protein
LGAITNPSRNQSNHRKRKDNEIKTSRIYKGFSVLDQLQVDERTIIREIHNITEEFDRHDSQKGKIVIPNIIQQLPAYGAKT